jgi:pyridoxal phosphate enzyme (YggS family)
MLSLLEIKDNLVKVEKKIVRACEEVNRKPSDIMVTLASKTMPRDLVLAVNALKSGLIFGENRAQELVEKWTPEITWHFIGRLQTNKVKYVAGKCALIQSLDSLKLAAEIDRQAEKHGIVQDCLLEINIAGDAAKGGIAPELACDFLADAAKFENVCIKGIMAVMPFLSKTELEPYYQKLYDLFKSLSEADEKIEILSAGMSHDYETAIKFGSNMLRLGTAVFGART